MPCRPRLPFPFVASPHHPFILLRHIVLSYVVIIFPQFLRCLLMMTPSGLERM